MGLDTDPNIKTYKGFSRQQTQEAVCQIKIEPEWNNIVSAESEKERWVAPENEHWKRRMKQKQRNQKVTNISTHDSLALALWPYEHSFNYFNLLNDCLVCVKGHCYTDIIMAWSIKEAHVTSTVSCSFSWRQKTSQTGLTRLLFASDCLISSL